MKSLLLNGDMMIVHCLTHAETSAERLNRSYAVYKICCLCLVLSSWFMSLWFSVFIPWLCFYYSKKGATKCRTCSNPASQSARGSRNYRSGGGLHGALPGKWRGGVSVSNLRPSSLIVATLYIMDNMAYWPLDFSTGYTQQFCGSSLVVPASAS